MKRVKHKVFCALACAMLLLPFGEAGRGFAQNYPIQITTQLAPPFSGFIPDYSTPGNQNLKLLVVFTDFTKPSYNIKLKLQITGQGITIQSKSYYYSGPITLQPGTPIEISGSDLSGLLNSANMDFSGINAQQYQTNALPEGYYNICFTAYDFNNLTPIQVSNQSCAFGWMVLSDPPFLNLPFCESTVNVHSPQNMMFQWTPMNMNSPNSANSTLYDFDLYEVRPGSQSPGNIIQTLPPIYQATTPFTFLNYGITEPQLYYGMQYVWRVRARDQSGRDLFKNQGYSQLCTFTYGSVLSQIDTNSLKLTLQGTALTYRLAKYTWDSLSIFISYKLEYRKQGSPNWFPINTTTCKSIANNLEPENTYEARVKGVFSEGDGPWSNVVTITTPTKPVIACGQGGIPPLASNFIPLKTGNIAQVWNIGQFELLITQLDNPNNPTGKYSGYGKIAIPFLANMNLNGKFSNITVNEAMEVVEGKVEIVTDGQSGGNLIDLDTLFTNIGNAIDNFIDSLNAGNIDSASLADFNNTMTTLLGSDSTLVSLQSTYDSIYQHLLDISTTAGTGSPNYAEIQDAINELNELKSEIQNRNSNQTPCDPNNVSPNLKLLANQSIACSSSFDTQFEPYRNMPELLKKLCIIQRINIIKCLIQGSVDDEDEEGIISLISATPKNQIQDLFNVLKNNGSELLQSLISQVTGTEFNIMLDALMSKVIELKGLPTFNSATLSNLISRKQFVAFDQWAANNQGFATNGYYTLFVRQNFDLCCEYTLATDPFNHVLIRFDDNFSITTGSGTDNYAKGTWLIAPAMFLPKIINEGENRTIHYAADIIGLYFGYTELKIAIQGGKTLAIALLDIGLTATDININIALIDELNKTQSGRSTINEWNNFAMCYGLARGSLALFDAAKNYYVNAKAYLLKPNTLTPTQQTELQKTIDEAKSIVQEKGANELVAADNEVAFIVSNVGNVVESANELAGFIAQHGIRSDINLDFVITLTKGRRDLCESILLSTTDVVDGKNLQQLVQHFNIPNAPSVNSLTNYQARIWYKSTKANIGNVIDKTKSLVIQAKQAFDLRNTYRSQTRQFMQDRNLADFLQQNELNEVWSNFVQSTAAKTGKSGNDLWNEIINKSMSGRERVDELFKLDGL